MFYFWAKLFLPLYRFYLLVLISLVLLLPILGISQQVDTAQLPNIEVDSSLTYPVIKSSALALILKENSYLNSEESPQEFRVIRRVKATAFNAYFYLILVLSFLYACFIYFYRKYVSDVFRLYLNTSLNKSQITDQLRQEELPSLLSNAIFIVGMALFATQFIISEAGKESEKIKYLGFISILLAIIYLVKYFSLRFTGWVSSFSSQSGLYIFIVFIVNKVLGFVIFPLAVILALASNIIKPTVLIVGVIIIMLFLLTRFIKAFNIIRSGASLHIFHFFIFIFSVEVLPLLLLYKAGKIYLTNLA